MKRSTQFLCSLVVLSQLLFTSSSFAQSNNKSNTQANTQSQSDKELAEMQKKLNAEILEKPFSVADEAKIDAYIKSAMSKDLKPAETAPNTWKAGYTCADIYSLGWSAYQNCRYYRHYYGRYWF
jgi:hypothetical protein